MPKLRKDGHRLLKVDAGMKVALEESNYGKPIPAEFAPVLCKLWKHGRRRHQTKTRKRRERSSAKTNVGQPRFVYQTGSKGNDSKGLF